MLPNLGGPAPARCFKMNVSGRKMMNGTGKKKKQCFAT